MLILERAQCCVGAAFVLASKMVEVTRIELARVRTHPVAPKATASSFPPHRQQVERRGIEPLGGKGGKPSAGPAAPLSFRAA